MKLKTLNCQFNFLSQWPPHCCNKRWIYIDLPRSQTALSLASISCINNNIKADIIILCSALRTCVCGLTSEFSVSFKLNYQPTVFPDIDPDDLQSGREDAVSLDTCRHEKPAKENLN